MTFNRFLNIDGQWSGNRLSYMAVIDIVTYQTWIFSQIFKPISQAHFAKSISQCLFHTEPIFTVTISHSQFACLTNPQHSAGRFPNTKGSQTPQQLSHMINKLLSQYEASWHTPLGCFYFLVATMLPANLTQTDKLLYLL